jgi:hypothetical protein
MSEAPKIEADKERKRGGQPGNTHGSGNARHGLKAGRLPKDARYIEVRMNIFRRELESAVVAAKGEICLSDAAYVQTAMRWERHAALAQRWLTKQHDEMTPTERLTFSREIARASAERDRAITSLALNAQEKSPWQLLSNGGQQ